MGKSYDFQAWGWSLPKELLWLNHGWQSVSFITVDYFRRRTKVWVSVGILLFGGRIDYTPCLALG